MTIVEKNNLIYVFAGFIILLALVFRVMNLWGVVFPGDDHTYLLGIDPYFYLRQVETMVRNFPVFSKFDHATHYPNGLESDVSGLYPWLTAGIARLIYGISAESDQIAGLMAWLPVLGTAGCYFFVFRSVQKLRNSVAGLFALFLLLVYPGLFLYRGVLGFPDHHIWEVFLALWMVYGLLSIKNFTDHRSSWHLPILACVPLFLIFTVWPGAHLYLLLIGLAEYILQINADKGQMKKYSQFSIIYWLGSGLIYYAFYWLVPQFFTATYSSFLPITGLIMMAIGMGSWLIYLYTKTIHQYMPSVIYQPLSYLGLILCIWLFLEFTPTGQEVFTRLTYKAGGIAENKEIGWSHFFEMLQLSGLIAVLAIILFSFFVLSGRLKNKLDVFFIFTAGFFVWMWMSTYDMGYMIAPFVSIISGVALYDITFWSIKKESELTGAARKIVSAIPYFIVGLCFILPMLRQDTQYPYRLSQKQAHAMNLYPEVWNEPLQYLADSTPIPPYPTHDLIYREDFDPDHPRHYGVFSGWDNGNVINQKGKRTPIWSRWPNDKTEKLLVFPPDSLKKYILESKQSIDYLLIDYRLASAFFMSKYIHHGKGSLSGCIDTTFLEMGGQVRKLANYDPCFKSSLIYRTYVEPDSSLNWIEKVFETKEESAIGYLYNSVSLTIQTFSREILNTQQIDLLNHQGYLSTPSGVFYDAYIVPSIQIFKINRRELLNNPPDS